jgi:transcriptional regulator with XRE-family HTH domain
VVRELLWHAGVTDVSSTLSAARTQAGLSLEELSARTRIRLPYLQAIERGEFRQLPGDFFTRAFLRMYAREVHLSPDDIVHAYEASLGPVEPAESTARGVARTRPVPPFVPAISGAGRAPSQLTDYLRRAWPIGAAAIVLVLVGFASMWPRPAADTGTVGTTGAVEAAVPVPASGSAAAPAPAPPPADRHASQSLLVELRATGTTWVTVTADGKRVVYRLFKRGDRATVEARTELSFRLGNASAVALSINGEPATLGGRGAVREFRITRDNYKSLLTSAR